MKKYYKNSLTKNSKNTLCLLALAQIILYAGAAYAQERDPFSPSGNGVMDRVKDIVTGDAQANNQQNSATTPITSTQLSGYKVVGVMISDSQKIASVKGISGVSYIVKVGDSIGSEGGKVSEITLEGITVQTESQAIKLPVSNIIEVPGESSEKNK